MGSLDYYELINYYFVLARLLEVDGLTVLNLLRLRVKINFERLQCSPIQLSLLPIVSTLMKY